MVLVGSNVVAVGKTLADKVGCISADVSAVLVDELDSPVCTDFRNFAPTSNQGNQGLGRPSSQ